MRLRFLLVSWGIKWNDPKVSKDIARWKKEYGITGSDKTAFAIFASTYPEFRNLMIYRHPKGFWKYWFKLWYKPIDTLYIYTPDIGGGLFIQHGFSTGISGVSMGENCWVNHEVTIGHSGTNGKTPIIGNNVTICCGAKVLGGVTVGDNAIIGANAVVVKDVEPGAVMGGVPAKRIR